MTDRSPVLVMLHEMEDDVADVERWGDLLSDLGADSGAVSRNGIYVIGCQLQRLGERLDAKWKAAFKAAGGVP